MENRLQTLNPQKNIVLWSERILTRRNPVLDPTVTK